MVNPANSNPPPIPPKPAGLRPAPPQIPPKPELRPATPDPSLQPSSPPLAGRVFDPRKSTILSSKPLGKIYRFFLRRLGQTEKITQAKAMAAEFDEKDKIALEKHITANVTRLKTAPKVSDYQELSDRIPRAKLPPERSLEAWKTAFEKKPIMNKVEAAKFHVNQVVADIQNVNPASRLESLDGKGWTGLRISKDGAGFTITEGHVSTTSERSTGTDNHSDLFNIYVHIADNGHIAISTAVIDTPRRAEEFMQAVTYALKKWQEENPDKTMPPPRIAMHQLNTHGVVGSLKLGEISLIEGENRMMTYMNLRFPAVLKSAELESSEGPHFIHKNHAINASSMLPQEAALSARNNLQGTAGQMLWLGQEIEKEVTDSGYAKIREDISKIQQNLIKLEFQALPDDEFTELGLRQVGDEQFTEAYERLHTLKDERQDLIDSITDELEDPLPDLDALNTLRETLKTNNQKIESIEKPFKKNTDIQATKAIKDQIQTERKTLHQQLSQLLEIQKRLVASRSLSDDAKEALELGNIILEDQLKYDTQNLISKRKFVSDVLSVANPLKDRDLSQTQRVALDLLLDQQLGITTQTNCKSSCDRTAVARALIECLPRITSLKDPERLATPAEQREFILSLEQGVRNMDAAFRGSGYETMQEFLLSSHSLPAFKSLYKFQVDMFNQLLAVGLPITGRSTGLEGLKFSHDTSSMGKNFHPLPLIPLEIYDEATGKTVQLVAFEKRNVLLKWGTGDWQSDRKLTDAGNWVLMGNAQGRGT